MCYLCEKYAPIDGIGAYEPIIDPMIMEADKAGDFSKQNWVKDK